MYIHYVAQETRIIRKLFIFNFFSSKKDSLILILFCLANEIPKENLRNIFLIIQISKKKFEIKFRLFFTIIALFFQKLHIYCKKLIPDSEICSILNFCPILNFCTEYIKQI